MRRENKCVVYGIFQNNDALLKLSQKGFKLIHIFNFFKY